MRGMGVEDTVVKSRVPVTVRGQSPPGGGGAGAGPCQDTVMDGLGPTCGTTKGKLRPTSWVGVRNHRHSDKPGGQTTPP